MAHASMFVSQDVHMLTTYAQKSKQFNGVKLALLTHTKYKQEK